MQDVVPITVTSLSQQLIQDNGVRDIKDLQVLVPGLTVTSTQNEAITTARIRGIGTVGDNVGMESSVGVVIDGVYRPRNSVGFGDLGEIERIEVLKDPQGTVFGKNTSAGVINVVTRKPDFEQRLDGEVTLGNYGARGVSGGYNDALGDKSAFSIFAAQRERDGWINVVTGAGPRSERDDYDQSYHTLRGKFLLQPSDKSKSCCRAISPTATRTAARPCSWSAAAPHRWSTRSVVATPSRSRPIRSHARPTATAARSSPSPTRAFRCRWTGTCRPSAARA